MKKYNYATLILAGLFIIVFSFSTVQAQEEMEADAPKQNINQKPRPNLLAELDLSQNQIQQIRRINQESKLSRREAQLRVREAQKALDQAIYADAANEVEIQTKLKNLQLAQAEIVKLRSTTEFAVRKVLTPEQLVKFREIRRRFMEASESRLNQPRNRQFNNANKPFNNRGGRLRPNN
jgi:Spy/CpxP family protein refolding chaperone